MTDLRTAAQQALEALVLWATGRDIDAVALNDLIFRLEAALAEEAMQRLTDVQQEIMESEIKTDKAEPVQEPDLSRCPNCGGPADNGHDRSIPPNPYFCTKCIAEPHTGVTLKPVLYADRRLTNEEIDAIVGRSKAEPVECPNCASLEAQNTELDAKLSELERKPLTTEEVERIWFDGKWSDRPSLGFVRAIERAHGIGEKK